MMFRRSLCLAAILVAALRATAHAQDPDLIRGRITGPDSLPIEGAAISVTPISGDLVKTARTDKNGGFTVTFPDNYGDYWVTVNAIGFQQRRFEIKRIADEDVLIADARMSHTVTMLSGMQVVGRRPTASRSDGMTDITGSDRYLGGSDVGMLGDLAAMAGMMPGVTYIPAANGSPAGFSVFGLDAAQNVFLLNGIPMGDGMLPRDAGASSSLSTNPYDASRGGFAGGMVNSSLPSGNNFIVRTMSATALPTQMQWADKAAQSQGLDAKTSIGGKFSGPIKMNRAFYNVSYQADRITRDLRTLFNTGADGLQAVGISQDSVDRLQDALDAVHMPFFVPGFPGSNLTKSGSVAGVFNYSPQTAQSQSFKLTFQGSGSQTLPANFQLASTPAHAGKSDRWNGVAGLQHSTYVRSVIFTNTTLSFTQSMNESSPYLLLPSASVRINSTFPDGTNGVSSFQAGGSPSSGTSSKTSGMQFRNALSWVSMDNKHRLSYTTEIGQTFTTSDQSANTLGSFSFNSLADFEAGKPSSFSRLLTPRRTRSGQTTLGLSLQDSWRVNPDLQMTLGVRMDGGRFSTRPERNVLIEQTFPGFRNDIVPNPITFSPRFSFSKNFGEAPQITFAEGGFRGPRQRISGGIVVAQQAGTSQLVNSVAQNTGLPSSIQTLTCVGTAVPTPNWTDYQRDPNTIPNKCADGTEGTVFSSTTPSATVVDPKYAPSRRITGNLGWSGTILRNRFSANVNGSYTLALNQQGQVDLNFDPTPRFTLAAEGNRPVYVNTTSIVTTTGSIASRDARKSQAFSHVNEITSNLRSDTRDLTISLSPMQYNSIWSYSIQYRLASNRRMVQGFQSTVGNPLDHEWGLNDQNAMHQFTFSPSVNLKNIVRLSWSISAMSGRPLTPRVAGDINGDGYSNDRPFIFDPAATSDSALAAGMRNLLDSGSPIAKDCLRKNLGKLSPLAACQGPWTLSGNSSINLTINPIKMRMPQRASLNFSISNPMGAVDLLFHGAGNIRGWGQQASPDQTLLYVRGFDATTKQFKYEVNQRFGSTRPQQSLGIRSPVAIQALLKIDIGPTRERQQLTQMLDRGRSTEGTMAPEAQFRSQYVQSGGGNIPNAMIQMLRQADQLKLTPDQADSIAYMNRWYTVHLDSIWTPVAKYFGSLPKDYDQGDAYGHYKEAREASVDLLIKVAPAILDLLTPEQKRLMNSSLMNYLDVKYLRSIRSSTANGGIYY